MESKQLERISVPTASCEGQYEKVFWVSRRCFMKHAYVTQILDAPQLADEVSLRFSHEQVL